MRKLFITVLVLTCVSTTAQQTSAPDQNWRRALVTQNNNGNFTFQSCMWSGKETDLLRDCQPYGKVSRADIEALDKSRECKMDAVHTRFTGTLIIGFAGTAFSAVALQGLYNQSELKYVTATAVLTALTGAIAYGIGYELDWSDTCGAYALLNTRLYETLETKIPNGYQKTEALDPAIFAIIDALDSGTQP